METKIKCCTDYRSGKSVSAITKEYSIPRSTVYYWLKKYKDIPDANNTTLKKALNNVQMKYEKIQQICEVLKTVNCTPSSPLKVRLNELEKLYGQYSISHRDFLNSSGSYR